MTILIGGLDLETTGTEQADGHRIIEVAILTYEYPSRVLVDEFVQRIDPDRSVPASSTAVHGITYADLVGMPKWEDVAGEVKRRMDALKLAVAHNAGFDGPFLGLELARAGLAVPDLDFFCTMDNGRWATPDGKSPKLVELCFALDIKFNQSLAHGARYDTAKTMECFFAGLDRGFYTPSVLAPTAILKVA